MTIPIEDMRAFARGIGRWTWGINPEMNAQQLEASIRKFLASAPLDVKDPDEFCRDAAEGYAEREKEYADLQAMVQPEEE